MVSVNCVSINNDLMAKELFGSEKGVFGEQKSKGAFERANGGSLFLNEIGDMNLETQKLLVHFLEKQSFKRVGGERNINVDVRILASTNKNLGDKIKEGSFKEELFFRLNVVPIHIPPLRGRKEDIPTLIDKLLKNENEKNQIEKKIDKSVIEKLSKCYFKGNVRELKNLIKRVLVTSKDNIITIEDLPEIYKN